MKKFLACCLAILMLTATLSACDITEFFSSEKQEQNAEKPNENEQIKDDAGHNSAIFNGAPYIFEFERIDDSRCNITNLIFNSDYKGDIVLEYPIESPDGLTVADITFLTDSVAAPLMILPKDFEYMVNTIEKNMEAKISSGEIPESNVADERHRLVQFESYFSFLSLSDVENTDEFKKVMLEKYPILAALNECYFSDALEMSPTVILRLSRLCNDYGITSADTVRFYENIREAVKKSGVDNSEELLTTVPDAKHAVSYPDNVKEILGVSGERVDLYCYDQIEKVGLYGEAVTIFGMENLQSVTLVCAGNNVEFEIVDTLVLKELVIMNATDIAIEKLIIDSNNMKLDTIYLPEKINQISIDCTIDTVNYEGTEEQWTELMGTESQASSKVKYTNINYSVKYSENVG